MTTLLRIEQVCQRTGLPRRSVYAEIAAGRFPRPVRVGSRAVAWVSTEIDAWVSDRIEARDREVAA